MNYLRRVYNFLTVDADSVRAILQKPMVLKRLGESPGKTLDCGCGRGLYTKSLTQRASSLCALDIREECVRITREATRRDKGVKFFLGSVEYLPFVDECFDTVLCTEVIEHIDNDSEAVAELARVLKTGGRLVLSVPSPPGYIDDRNKNPYGHKREGYALSEIVNLLRQNELTTVRYVFCFFRFSHSIRNLMAKYVRILKMNPPFFILLPVFLDRMSVKHKQHSLPFDIIIEAKKCEGSSDSDKDPYN